MRLSTLAGALAVDPSALASLNPGMRRPVLSDSKYVPRNYALRVPPMADAENRVAAISSDLRYASQIRDRNYVIQPGDTLSLIAQRYGTTVSRLMQANNLRNMHRIRARRWRYPGWPRANRFRTAPIPTACAGATPSAGSPAGRACPRTNCLR